MSDHNKPALPSRRALLAGGAAAALGVLVAPGIRLIEIAAADDEAATLPGVRPAGTAASAKVRWGMLIDTTRCSPDCDACITACKQENHLPATSAPTDPQWVRKVSLKDLKTGRSASVPVMCQHCAKPACVDVCPTGASFKRADGIVLVDRHACIGCRYCMMACPYKARSFVHAAVTDQNPEVPRGKGCVEGCTLCVHRVDKGQLPVCVESCPNEAMLFGDLNDPDSAIAQRLRTIATTQVRADLGLDTGVRYHGI